MADSGTFNQKPRDDWGSLSSGSFLGLLFTQFLTATNDNVFRWLVIGIGKDYVDPSQVGKILMLGTVLFVVPYLGLAAIAGYLADRFPKNQVIVGCTRSIERMSCSDVSIFVFEGKFLVYKVDCRSFQAV